MKTIVLDDDPTGTQSATGVTVLLESDADLLTDALRHADSVYVQTNSRALDEATAVALIRRIRADGEEAARRLGDEVRFVLRGDSTLRGHVFAETEVFLDGDAVMLFVPAFPDGGRTTRDGVHLVRVDGVDVPAHESEYADDPVFGFSTGVLVDYVGEKSGRLALSVPLATVRGMRLRSPRRSPTRRPAPSSRPTRSTRTTSPRSRAPSTTRPRRAATVVVRCAAPLAAELAGVASRSLLPMPLVPDTEPVLLVCGSHTAGASAQLEPLVESWGAPAVIDTDAALREPEAAGMAAAEHGARAPRHPPARHRDERTQPVRVAQHARARREGHGRAHDGRARAAARRQGRRLEGRHHVGRGRARRDRRLVGGRARAGASRRVRLAARAHDGRELLYVVVPGNVGAPDTLVRVLDSLRVRTAADADVVS